MDTVAELNLSTRDIRTLERLTGTARGELEGFVLLTRSADGFTGIITNACCLAHASGMAVDILLESAPKISPCPNDC